MEAMAQAGAVIMLSEIADRNTKLAVFTGIEGAKFRRPITPGDQIRIEVDVWLPFRVQARWKARRTSKASWRARRPLPA